MLDARAEVERIVDALRKQVLGMLRRRGVVVGLSGGIDSSVVATLCTRALGNDKVLGLFMPERDSSGDSLRLGRRVAAQLGIDSTLEDLTPALEATGAYRRQLEAIQAVVPDYGDGWKCKLGLASVLNGNGLNISRLTVEDPEGKVDTVRLSPAAYLQVVAATNYKQRLRKTTEYYHADRLKYAVAGTPNLLEYDQGFFVKQGDGTADLMPIVHLYKSQVYQLAEYLGVDEEVRRREPTTDTFSLAQSQEEFYFALPYHQMDLCLYGLNNGIASDEVAAAAGLTEFQLEKVYKDVEAKRRAARYLHARPLLAGEIGED